MNCRMVKKLPHLPFGTIEPEIINNNVSVVSIRKLPYRRKNYHQIYLHHDTTLGIADIRWKDGIEVFL
jgi:hypothetical protein